MLLATVLRSRAATLPLSALLAGAVAAYSGTASLRVTSSEALVPNLTVRFKGETNRAQFQKSKELLGPWWLGWQSAGQACLEFNGYPPQFTAPIAQRSDDFQFPAQIKWPLVIFEGDSETKNFLEPGKADLKAELKMKIFDAKGPAG